MYVCKAGHMATRTARTNKKDVGKNQRQTYYFDIEKCKTCPLREGAKSKTYSVTIKSTEHKDQEAFQNSEEFKEKAKSRYKIEAKNAKLNTGTVTMLHCMRVYLACRCKGPSQSSL